MKKVTKKTNTKKQAEPQPQETVVTVSNERILEFKKFFIANTKSPVEAYAISAHLTAELKQLIEKTGVIKNLEYVKAI